MIVFQKMGKTSNRIWQSLTWRSPQVNKTILQMYNSKLVK